MTSELILIGISAFIIKHYIADFLLQTPYMLRKGNDTDWVVPLLLHSTIHGI